MADFASVADAAILVDSTQSMTGPRFSYSGTFSILALDAQLLSGAYISVGPGVIAPSADDYASVEAPWEVIGYDWFNKVHLIPRSKLEFGNIVTSLSYDYELFNAWKSDVTLTSITNNAGAGVTLPDAPTPPALMPSFTSFLDPTSTRLNPIKLSVVADEDGLPTFDSTIDFLFDTGEDPFLELSGNRIALLPNIYEEGFTEKFSFLTDIIESINGKEQRISLRRFPRQSLTVSYMLTDEERQRMQTTLYGWQSKLFAVPMWHEQMPSTVDASISDSSIAVPDTTYFDFRVDGLAVVYTSATQYDVVLISAVNTNSIEFTGSPLLNAHPAGAKVVPVRLAYVTNSVRGARYLNNLERFDMTLVVADNDTGSFEGSTTGWSTFNSKVLLDDPNILDGTEMPHEFSQRVTVVDNDTGNIQQVSTWDRHKRSTTKGFVAKGRANIKKLRQLLLSLGGPQKSFYLPTFIEDLTPAAGLSNGTPNLDINHIGFARFAGDVATPKNVIRVTFTDGTTLERTILSATEQSSTVERLVVDTNWPTDRTVDEIERIEFLELSRFDTDEFTLRYPTVGTVVLKAPVKTVFA